MVGCPPNVLPKISDWKNAMIRTEIPNEDWTKKGRYVCISILSLLRGNCNKKNGINKTHSISLFFYPSPSREMKWNGVVVSCLKRKNTVWCYVRPPKPLTIFFLNFVTLILQINFLVCEGFEIMKFGQVSEVSEDWARVSPETLINFQTIHYATCLKNICSF